MTSESDRIEATRLVLEQAVLEAGGWISGDGRIGEDVAAQLLGLACGTLANRRAEGTAPPYYRIGGGGHRITYRLIDLAAWIERERVDW